MVSLEEGPGAADTAVCYKFGYAHEGWKAEIGLVWKVLEKEVGWKDFGTGLTMAPKKIGSSKGIFHLMPGTARSSFEPRSAMQALAERLSGIGLSFFILI